MNGARIWLAAVLLAAVAAWAFWYGSGSSTGTAGPADRIPAASPPASEGAPRAQATSPSMPSPAAGAGRDGSGLPSAEPPDSGRGNALDELAAEVAVIALERLGDHYVDYLVANGLSRADSEDIVSTGFHAASRCTLEAMREQARAESVPLDSVLYALHAELYDTDGPLLSSTIDLQAVRIREAPCALNALQEAGIPPSVAQEIQRAAASR